MPSVESETESLIETPKLSVNVGKVMLEKLCNF